MTDARFSGGSVGLVIGHVAPEAYLGGPIALIHDGDTIVVDVNRDRMDCLELDDAAELDRRTAAWQSATDANGGSTRCHPGRFPDAAPHALQRPPRPVRRGMSPTGSDRFSSRSRRTARRNGD